MQKDGQFITFEGVDGAGKSTQIQHFGIYLAKKGYEVLITKEPGGSELGQQIRNMCVTYDLDQPTQFFLMMAARRHHMTKTVIPWYTRGKIILCDRFVESTLAYQHEIDPKLVSWCQDVATSINEEEMLEPDFTFFLDCDPEIAVERIRMRSGVLDKMDGSVELIAQRRKRFDAQFLNHEGYSTLIDGSKSVEETTLEIIAAYEGWLEDPILYMGDGRPNNCDY